MKVVVKEDGELLSYLYKSLAMSKKRIKTYLTHGLIYIHNSVITQYNYPITKGMEIFIDTKKSKMGSPFIDILYEDSYILVVNKPSGLLTISTSKEKENTLYHYVSMYLKQQNKNNKVFIVHRLDQDTSGVLLFAKDSKTKEKLQKNWNSIVKCREYTAVVVGKLTKQKERLVHPLCETKTNLVYISNKGNYKTAITNYEVMKTNQYFSLLKVNIETGRKNQIRAQLAYIGHPIVGDKKYGDAKSKYSRLYLHAHHLRLFYPMLKKELSFTAKVPDELMRIL